MKTIKFLIFLFVIGIFGVVNAQTNVLVSDDVAVLPGTTAVDGLFQVSRITSLSIDVINRTTLAANVENEMSFKTGTYWVGSIKTIGSGAASGRLGFFTGTSVTRSNLLERMTIMNTGRVGIGSINPNTLLDVVGGASGVQTTLLTLRSNFVADNTATGLKLINSTGVGSVVGAEMVALTLTSANGRSDLLFFVHGGGGANGALLERVRICGNGNLGIGITAPTEKLDVVGNVKFSGALMPNNLAGTAGNLLTSAGAGAVPTWSTFTIGNPGATTQIAKYYSSFSWTGTWPNNTFMTFTTIDANCRNESCITVAIDGPWNALYAGIRIRSIVCEVGQFRVTVENISGSGLTGGIPISFIAFY